MTTALTKREVFAETIHRARSPIIHHFGGDEEQASAFLTALNLASFDNPKIMECRPGSIIQATLHCSRLRLVPNDGQEHVYLIPYGTELQAQIGFRGYIELAMRSGKVRSLQAEVVYEDEIKSGNFSASRAPFMVMHSFDVDAKRTTNDKIVAAYAMATLASGSVVGVLLQASDIERAKSKAQGTTRSDSPWKQWPDRMARKTAIKALLRSGQVPLSANAQEAVAFAMEQEHGIDPGVELTQDAPMAPLELPDVSDLESPKGAK